MQYGTGTAAGLPDRPVAGKTGTTELNTDAWFNGITPQLATSVWMGDPKGRTPMSSVGGIAVFGGTYPARIWRTYTEGALSGQPAVNFPAPDPNKIPGGRMITSSQLLADSPFANAPTFVPAGPSTPRNTVILPGPVTPATSPPTTIVPRVTVPSIPLPTFPTFPPITIPCRHRCTTTTT